MNRSSAAYNFAAEVTRKTLSHFASAFARRSLQYALPMCAMTLTCSAQYALQPVDFIGYKNPSQAPEEPLSLWYRQPAKQWTEALAIGNGRLGAMIFGGAENEHIHLNEDTFWAGGPHDPNNTNALAALPEVRRLIFDGKYTEAHKLVA